MGVIISGERQLTSEALNERALRAATALAGLGVGVGDGVALYLRNDIPYFEASAAAGMLGAYPVPVNWHYTPDEAAYLLRDSAARALVIHADLLATIAHVIPKGVAVAVVETPPEIRAAYGISPEAGAVPAGSTAWSELLEVSAPRTEPPLPAPSTIIYTSGTTGRPKGVKRAPMSPETAQAAMTMLAWSYGLTDYLNPRSGLSPGDITTAVLGPVYHAAPNAHSGFAIRTGANVVITPRFDAQELLRLIETHRITHLNMVPIMFARLLKLPEGVKRRYDLSSLRFVAHAAAPCPPPVKRAMIEWWGPVINEYYGSTEMGNVTFCTAEEWLAHPGSVGRVMPGARVRVVDEEGRDQPAGEVGEVIGGLEGFGAFTYPTTTPSGAAWKSRG